MIVIYVTVTVIYGRSCLRYVIRRRRSIDGDGDLWSVTVSSLGYVIRRRCSIDGDGVKIPEAIDRLSDVDDGDDVVPELLETMDRSYDGDNGDEIVAGVETLIYVMETGIV